MTKSLLSKNMHNLLNEEFLKLAEDFGEMPRKQIENLLNKNYSNVDDYLSSFKTRDVFTKVFGWSIPCKEAVNLIKSFTHQTLYDVMAGTGYWARILKKANLDVRASDIHKIKSKNYYHTPSRIFSKIIFNKSKIRRKNAIKIAYDISKKRIKGDVFLSWPPYQSCAATNILEYVPLNTKVFYIGEGCGGCTGDLSFHLYLKENFSLLAEENLPNFTGIHDYLSVYEKKYNKKIQEKYKGKSFSWDVEEDEFTNDV